MALKRTTLPLALVASLALALPAGAAEAAGPVAHAAGSGAAATDPPIVGVPITRTANALGNAADAIDSGNGAQAVGPLRASRRYLIRSYKGAKYLIDNAPPAPPAADGRASARRFIRLARRSIRASRSGAAGSGGWIRAQTSGAEGGGPAFADAPTAVFDVFTSQFNAATAAVGMVPDTQGNLLAKVQTTLNTAVVLRNRLVKVVHAASPPAPPAADGRVDARASGAEPGGASFDAVMPGLIVLIDAELQQMQAMAQDTSVPAASQAALTKAIAADKQIEARVNLWWPPLPADD
jgi:hypothetical protein